MNNPPTKHLLAALLLVLCACLVVAFTWLFVNYKQATAQVALLSTPEGQMQLQEEEVSEILAAVSGHMLLPAEQNPVVATIVNAESLATEQAFYANAEDGDMLLVYQEKAIIYSPTRDLIVNVGPVLIEPPAEQANAQTPPVPTRTAPAPVVPTSDDAQDTQDEETDVVSEGDGANTEE